jgi:D-beta-D-heptose 7-phosphate kinase/D-beta-D-heptose 1-phosphate adenosyltransferase
MNERFAFDRPRLNLHDLMENGLRAFQGTKVLVVGDLILDHYLWGNVERTTPEAPVAIVQHERDSWGLGGAANVARSVAALGGVARLIGVVGQDSAADRLREGMREEGLPVGGLVTATDRPTTLKTRVMSMGQQILRIDIEKTSPLDAATTKKVVAAIERQIKGCGAALLSDYAKGVLGPEAIGVAIEAARREGIPLLVDPKGKSYAKYKGADLLTPNRKEASEAVGRSLSTEAEYFETGRELVALCGLQAIIITLGAAGSALVRPRRKIHMSPARAREVYDVTGAGDTTIATLALSVAAGLGLEDASVLANHASGIVVAKLGAAVCSPDELRTAFYGQSARSKVRDAEDMDILLANHRTKGRKIVFTNGCFDLLNARHIQFLHEAKRLGDVLVVGLNTDRSVAAIKGQGRPILPESERAAILSALEVVDYLILFDELTPEDLLERLRPDVLAKGSNIPSDQIVGRKIVEKYGGKVRRITLPDAKVVGDPALARRAQKKRTKKA